MRVLLIFLDGIGLGAGNPDVNPFSVANMPTLTGLTNGKRWLAGIGRQVSERAVFRPIDPRMGVAGRPQSGTGHATIITGKNVPALTGKHYGPKPNAATREIVAQGSFFREVVAAGKQAALLTAYPPFQLHDIERGKTLPSSFQRAAMDAGLPLRTADDLRAGKAISADWTSMGWRRHLGFADMPLLSSQASGERLAALAGDYDFAMVSHFFTDFVGHRGPLEDGISLLETFDAVMAGLLPAWDDEAGLIVVTSDHGNMEDVSIRQHTENDVPLLAIGAGRGVFAERVTTLADIVPALRHLLLA
jgi:2,3-bisphosphoglycerate-independent phosphoglycerate mutase